MELYPKLEKFINDHKNVLQDIPRTEMIQRSIDDGEAVISANGSCATWTPIESTGRSPKDTMIVRRPESEADIDWNSPNNIPLDPETFDMILEETLKTFSKKEKIYITNRVLSAEVSYALPVRTICDQSLTALFTDNMFRPVPEDISESVFADNGFTILVLPYDKLDRKRYKGRLRTLPDGKTSNMAIVMDFDKRIGVVYGSAYGGSVKKLMFTVMNYYLPAEGILPLHCSANEGANGDSALLLGLSGTGKTTLSADPKRALLGDDEHG
ncbi:MAG TPA: phosphoenolpyruvate carboxykinase (ATP), partial [Candidatus Cloacimonetes bacterium]|nr:phosphoenolpyruvate carboxykinase (ATP) [Candidatus Cloacimonadota bacterium]